MVFSISNLIYACSAKGEVQPWNDPDKRTLLNDTNNSNCKNIEEIEMTVASEIKKGEKTEVSDTVNIKKTSFDEIYGTLKDERL